MTEIKLPPLPEHDMCGEAYAYSNDAMQDYARAAIEADRKRRGEPDFFTYVINGHHRGISETAPPDDSYDEGTLQPLYTAPQPQQQAGEPVGYGVFWEEGGHSCSVLKSLESEALNFVTALNIPGAVVEPVYRHFAPQPPQIPEGWQLVPIEPTEEMIESGWMVGDVGMEGIYKAMLAAAPKPEDTP